VAPREKDDGALLPDAGEDGGPYDGAGGSDASVARVLTIEGWRDLALDAGIPETVFWRQTQRETVAHLRADANEQRRAYELALFAAWHVEAFARCERLPELAPLMAQIRGENADEQDAEDQMNAARAIAASFGAV